MQGFSPAESEKLQISYIYDSIPVIMRSHYCGELNEGHVKQDVALCGWVHRRRDHGGVIFLDLRDREGIAQVVYDPDTKDAFALAESVRNEFVLRVTGTVRPRPAGTVNEDMPSGRVEVLGKGLEILSAADTPPILPNEYSESGSADATGETGKTGETGATGAIGATGGTGETGEEARLLHRYLDLRRPEMTRRLRLRAEVAATVRGFLQQQGFLEIETPLLTRATPEGARDYLVPSRTHPGSFFALPQSPQLFKQLLMASGMERYYQIARCFRDEDLRADRQPEFTQIDVEASFVDEAAVMEMMEALIRYVFKTHKAVELGDFPRLSYAEAVRRYGSDRPDLRCDLELVDIADLMQEVEFKVFRGPAEDPDGRVALLRLPGGAALSRGEIDAYTAFVAARKAKGLAWIKVNDRSSARGDDKSKNGLQSPILKFLPAAAVESLLQRSGAESGDILFFGAGKAAVVNESLGALRVKLAGDRGLLRDGWAPLWVTDFPMFGRDTDGRLSALHHPFTAPACDEAALLSEPETALSRAYDMVLNGSELGGGSIRINRRPMQEAVFKVLGIGPKEAEEKFGFLLRALSHGCPPHGGIAFGFDRLIMLLAGAASIREVIAFPKTQSAACPLTRAPGEVAPGQLRELHIKRV